MERIVLPYKEAVETGMDERFLELVARRVPVTSRFLGLFNRNALGFEIMLYG